MKPLSSSSLVAAEACCLLLSSQAQGLSALINTSWMTSDLLQSAESWIQSWKYGALFITFSETVFMKSCKNAAGQYLQPRIDGWSVSYRLVCLLGGVGMGWDKFPAMQTVVQSSGFYASELVLFHPWLKKLLSPVSSWPAAVLSLSWAQQRAAWVTLRLLNLQSSLRLRMPTELTIFNFKKLRRICCPSACSVWPPVHAVRPVFSESWLPAMSALLSSAGLSWIQLQAQCSTGCW